jgi:hypothetical protein
MEIEDIGRRRCLWAVGINIPRGVCWKDIGAIKSYLNPEDK